MGEINPPSQAATARRGGNAEPSDALVFFGATGDLAHKKIFPALQHMIRRGTLDVPVIGVAKSGWTLEQLQARARDSLTRHGGGVDEAAFAKLVRLLRYVDGDYQDPATFDLLRKELGAPRTRRTIWPFHPACSVRWSRRSVGRGVRKTPA